MCVRERERERKRERESLMVFLASKCGVPPSSEGEVSIYRSPVLWSSSDHMGDRDSMRARPPGSRVTDLA